MRTEENEATKGDEKDVQDTYGQGWQRSLCWAAAGEAEPQRAEGQPSQTPVFSGREER